MELAVADPAVADTVVAIAALPSDPEPVTDEITAD